MTTHRTRDGDRRVATTDSWDQVRTTIACCGMAARLGAELAAVPGLHLEVSEHLEGSARDADILIGFHFPPGSLSGLPKLRWVHLTGTGTDHLAATGLPDDVLVTTSADVPVVAVAEYALSGLLLLLKDLPGTAARHDMEWFGSDALLLSGSTVAVVGAGRIGSAVIARVAAFGAETVAVTRDGRSPVPGADRTVSVADLAREAERVDHLICCLPGGPDAAGVVDRKVFGALPPHAVIVNVGRAEAIDTSALHDALKAGDLRGAFLDVHEHEPLPEDDPAWTVPGLVVSPHRAFAFPDEPREVAHRFLANLASLRGGQPGLAGQVRVRPGSGAGGHQR